MSTVIKAYALSSSSVKLSGWMSDSRPLLIALAQDQVDDLKTLPSSTRLWFIADSGDIVEDSLLSFAIKSKAMKCIEYGLSSGWDSRSGQVIWAADKPGRRLSWGSSVLHTLASIPDVHQMVFVGKKIIEAGELPDRRNSHGLTPLHVAAAYGSPVLLELLLQKGADVNARDTDGMTPLLFAMASGKVKNMEKLSYWGGDLKVVDKQGQDAARHALQSANVAMICKVIEFGLLDLPVWNAWLATCAPNSFDKNEEKEIFKCLKMVGGTQAPAK